MNRNYIFLADGFEEIEAVTPVDVMRRAGLDVKTVSITGNKEVKGAHGVSFVCDLLFEETDFNEINWLILPGGLPGSQNLYDFAPLKKLLISHAEKKGNIAAICAAPGVVLGQLGLLDGQDATCYPGFEKHFTGGNYKQNPIVVSDNIITANGPATALKFALAIIASEIGAAESANIGKQMMLNEK